MTANVRDWLVLNASPDLRPQIKATLALHPVAGLRSSRISVVVTGRDIDVVAGLLHPANTLSISRKET